MKENTRHIADLIQKFLFGQLTAEEQVQLDEWLKASSQNKQLLESFRNAENIAEDLAIIRQLDANQAWGRLKNKEANSRRFFWKWPLSIAASIVFLLGGFLLWKGDFASFFSGDKSVVVAKKQDIAPATSGAVLVLADGTKVSLNGDSTKTLTKNNNLIGNSNELIVKQTDQAIPLQYNSLIVPKASFYKMTLADGTKVWVNALSQLKFPAQFSAKERRVFLEGEAYFEVAPNAAQPFIVESFKDNLVKGRADLAHDLAWHNNEFYFKKETITNIAHQLSRWYDLDVTFRGDVQLDKEYTGSIERDVKLSQVLEMLSYVSNLKFEVEGNKLIIATKS